MDAIMNPYSPGACSPPLELVRMVYSPAHGDMAFTVPLFDKFMIRAIPKFTP
jgi:hypothetical protein